MAYNMDAPIVLMIGTRPEGIKMIPIYFACKKAHIPVVICSTLQHVELLKEVFVAFDVTPDFSLDIMRPGQDLFYVTQSVLQKTKELFMQIKPALVIVQGDTTSSMAAGLSAFYLKIPVAHIEAGLRTDDLHAPFPEEMNRRVLRSLATYHFPPTSWNAAQLLSEGIDKKQIFCVGNTVVDALHSMKKRIACNKVLISQRIRQKVVQLQKEQKKIMVLTLHRRESFGDGVQSAFRAVRAWLSVHPDVFCVYPFHPNPHIIDALTTSDMISCSQVALFEPLSYPDLVYVLDHADYVVTDSGGIQEEAVSLGKSVVVLRKKTERIEAVWSGAARLVGTDEIAIKAALDEIYGASTMQSKLNNTQLYGDGHAAEKIVHILVERVHLKQQELSERGAVTKAYAVQCKKGYETMNIKEHTKITVVGLGYIGLPTTVVLAEAGHTVIGVDIDANKVAQINAGNPTIKEPELFEKLQCIKGANAFHAQTTVEASDYFIIAVPTPCTRQKKVDLTAVDAAIDAIIPVFKKGDVVIIESTVPVGTTERIADKLANTTGLQCGKDFFVAHCPERVLPGNIFHELVHNTRIIGGVTQSCVEHAKKMYLSFVKGQLYLTNAKTAELIKLIENSSRDVQIAFAHQVAAMADEAGLDPYKVIELANMHPRVDILRPSAGVGGHCLAVDPWFLIETFESHTTLIKEARQINDTRPLVIAQRIQAEIVAWQKNRGKQPTIALCGMTYKADIDDLRESPACIVAQKLTTYNPILCEPHVDPAVLANSAIGRIMKFDAACQEADIIVLLVAHSRFKTANFEQLSQAGKKIIDVCGLLHVPRSHDSAQEHYFWPARMHGEMHKNNPKIKGSYSCSLEP